MVEENLSFRNGNPGAVQFGNFINYYQFNSPEKRISLLPKDIWSESIEENRKWEILDIGCNTGDLTVALYDFFTNILGITDCKVIGIDIDPQLIQRAIEKNKSNNISFNCVDIMDSMNYQTIIKYLKDNDLERFDLVTCFSITMWIHLNHGDLGLKSFLNNVSKISNFLIIEPQPWKCYKAAVKRMKLSDYIFPEFKKLAIQQNVEDEIEKIILDECNLVKLKESQKTDWGRKILFFKRKN
ncbi:probable RNA methyltransferase CG11342 [Sitophilus oryzae]|uniref:RNA methyltransferase n=1 Tax=Sitophilus oryzae TaxID=7048 RepID=A0A6J2XAV1_SITOR|nr:probable RNA methyltransferase CG11342 [Sitophilus oryzae]